MIRWLKYKTLIFALHKRHMEKKIERMEKDFTVQTSQPKTELL